MKFQNNHSRGCRDGRRPTSRKGIFWDVTAQHWGKLLALGGVLLVCALPLLGLRIYEDICILTLQQELSGEELLAQMISLRNTNAILEIPAMVLLFVAVAAVLRPLRQFAWGEIVSVGEELLAGLKQNAGHGALCGVLTALGCASAKIGMNMAAVTQDATSLLFSLPMWLMVLLVPLMGYTLVCICIYNNRFFCEFENRSGAAGQAPLPDTAGGSAVHHACVAGMAFSPVLCPNVWRRGGNGSAGLGTAGMAAVCLREAGRGCESHLFPGTGGKGNWRMTAHGAAFMDERKR